MHRSIIHTCMSVHTNMFYTVLIVSALAHGYHCIFANLTANDPASRTVPLRRSADLAESLRRQLMRDNYDYQTANTDDERNKDRQQNKQKGGSSNQPNKKSKVHDQLGNQVVTADTRERWHADANYVRETQYNSKHNARQVVDTDYDNNEHSEHNAEDNNYANEMREAIGPDFTPYKRDKDDSAAQDKPEAYDPTYSKRRDEYSPIYSLDKRDAHVANRPMQVAPVTYPIHVARAKDDSRDSQDTHDAVDTADVLTTRDSQGEQDVPDTDDGKQPDNRQTDFIENNAFQGTENADAIQDTPVLNLRVSRIKHDTDKKDKHKAGHAIAKKDLLYYMDDDHMRRKNDASNHSTVAEQAARNAVNHTTHRAPDASIISLSESEGEIIDRDAGSGDSVIFNQNKRSTVSTDNVTYKLLTMRSRSGRRSGARHLVEERVPGGGVALLSLDRAPLPLFHLPRSRRQYMHERRDNRPPLPIAKHRHHHHTKH